MVALIALAAAIAAALIYTSREPRRISIAECKRLYGKARSALDSAVVDEQIPFDVTLKFRDQRVKCGVLRQVGELR
jgi:hypothetical protein